MRRHCDTALDGLELFADDRLRFEPTTVFGHEGSSVGGTTSFVTLPEHGIVIAITTNVSFAKSLATERELGAGVRPFFRASSLSRVLANIFARANAAAQR